MFDVDAQSFWMVSKPPARRRASKAYRPSRTRPQRNLSYRDLKEGAKATYGGAKTLYKGGKTTYKGAKKTFGFFKSKIKKTDNSRLVGWKAKFRGTNYEKKWGD